MSPKATEGVAACGAPASSATPDDAGDLCETTPSGRFAAISPSRGEIGASRYFPFELLRRALAGSRPLSFLAAATVDGVVKGEANADFSAGRGGSSPRGFSRTTTQPSRSLVARCA
jgi:hypothetical protein